MTAVLQLAYIVYANCFVVMIYDLETTIDGAINECELSVYKIAPTYKL